MSKLEQAREHVFYAEISGQVAGARLRQRVERERLTRALGAWGMDTAFRLPDKLMALPSKPKTLPWVESEAVRRRVDLVIARMEIDILAKELGLTRKTRFINALEVAGVSTTEKDVKIAPNGDVEVDKIKRRGFDLDFQIPIYDFGESRVRLAEETYMRAVNRLLERAVNVRSEAREAYQGYRGAYDIARHYDREVLPLRQDHLGRNAAQLQRHDPRPVCPACRCARAHPGQRAGHRSAARLLARQRRPPHRHRRRPWRRRSSRCAAVGDGRRWRTRRTLKVTWSDR